MRYLTPTELGFSPDGDTNETESITLQAIKKRAEQTQQKSFNQSFASRITSNNNLVISKMWVKFLIKLRTFRLLIRLFLSKEPPKDSYLLPPEGENIEYDDDILEEIQEAAKEAAAKLAAKNKNGKVKFYKNDHL